MLVSNGKPRVASVSIIKTIWFCINLQKKRGLAIDPFQILIEYERSILQSHLHVLCPIRIRSHASLVEVGSSFRNVLGSHGFHRVQTAPEEHIRISLPRFTTELLFVKGPAELVRFLDYLLHIVAVLLGTIESHMSHCPLRQSVLPSRLVVHVDREPQKRALYQHNTPVSRLQDRSVRPLATLFIQPPNTSGFYLPPSFPYCALP